MITFSRRRLLALAAAAPVAAGDRAITHELADGQILIKPRLKYELVLSLHVLEYAEDHHQLLVPWAETVRRSLRPPTRAAARTLIRESQWDPLESTCRHASLSIL